TQRALALPAAQLPESRDTEQTPAEKFRADALWAAAQCLCAGRSVDAALVTNRQDVAEFCSLVLRTPEDRPMEHRLLRGWRREALGEDLLRLIRGRSKIELEWPDGRLKANVERKM